MKIEQRTLASLTPYHGNPWKHDEASIAAVAESIRRYGWRQPIVADAEGVIICGHGRYLAAQRLGLEKVPVHVADDLTLEQAREYRLADNGTHTLGRWDVPALSLELGAMPGLDVATFGIELDLPPNFGPGSIDDQGDLDGKKTIKCPECGHEFTA